MKVQDFDPRDYLRLNQFPHFLCPGCGHGIALRALVWAIHELELSLDKMAFVSGIGCSGRLTAYIDSNTFHVTHGRPIAFATGIALTRPDLKVVVITGDGDCLAIGGNHLIHACRRNLEMTCLMLNNEVYGMTEASYQMSSNPLPPAERKAGTVGIAAGPEVAIIDETGKLLQKGEIGEIVIRGDKVTSGYENNPKANAENFTNDWFRTGDQGVMDAQGYLSITGRLKTILNRGGEKISLREVDEGSVV